MGKNRLSHSSVTTYLECSMKYKLHYIDKIRTIKTKSAFIFGHALDCAFNVLLKERDLQKALRVFLYRMDNSIINGKRVKVSSTDLVSYTKNDLDMELINYYECKELNNLSWHSLCLKGKLIIEAYHREVLPKIKKVISVQKKISLVNEDGDSIGGLLDAVVVWKDGKIYLIDNKSSTVKYEDDSVRESNQLALYHYVEKDNIKLDGAGFIVLNKNINKNRIKTCKKCKTICETNHKTCNITLRMPKARCNGEFEVTINPTVDIEYFFNTIEPEDEERVIEAFDKVNQGIENKEFVCNGDQCYTKFGKCVYWDYCKTGSMEGLVNLKEKK